MTPDRSNARRAIRRAIARAAFLAGLGLLVSGCTLPAPRASQPAAGAAVPRATALLVTATNPPLRVPASDGMDHVEYDLLLTNAFTAPVTLASIEVIAQGRTLLRLAGGDLEARAEPLFFPVPNATPSARIPASGSVAVVVDLVVPRGAAPERISHRIAYDLAPDTPAAALIAGRTIEGPEFALDPRAPIVVAPPLVGDGWFAGNGCCDAYSVHRSPRVVVDGARYVKAETFAIDWLRLRDGRMWDGDGTRNEQYHAFGADVVAAAGGVVVHVRADMPDETPRQPPRAVLGPGDFLGNHVVVRIEPGVWAVYAHLQAGSVAARNGDRVAVGQVLGRLGNSGNSSEAHLHFQLSDGPDALTSTSLPFVFNRYTLEGTVDAVTRPPAGTTESPTLRIAGPPRRQAHTYPLVTTVQAFP